MREGEELSREEPESADRCRKRKHDQRPSHDQWRFSTFARDLAARFAEENDDQQAHHVKGSQKRREQTHDEDWHVPLIGERQNCVLAEKSAEGRATDQRERTNRRKSQM